MIDQCVIETVEGGFPEVNKYVHASCLGFPKNLVVLNDQVLVERGNTREHGWLILERRFS